MGDSPAGLYCCIGFYNAAHMVNRRVEREQAQREPVVVVPMPARTHVTPRVIEAWRLRFCWVGHRRWPRGKVAGDSAAIRPSPSPACFAVFVMAFVSHPLFLTTAAVVLRASGVCRREDPEFARRRRVHIREEKRCWVLWRERSVCRTENAGAEGEAENAGKVLRRRHSRRATPRCAQTHSYC